MKDYKTVRDEEGNESKEYFETQSKIPIIEIHLYEQQLSLIEEVITHKKSQTIWRCPRCFEINLEIESPRSDRQYGSNATFGVIYERPIKNLVNRSIVDRDSMRWVTDFLREIDVGLMAFQKAYFDEHGFGMKEDISPFPHEAIT